MWGVIKTAFVNGCYVSTILLAKAFIERKFQSDYCMISDTKRSRMTLNQVLEEMKQDKFLEPYWIERIDKIRKKRNRLAHFKNVSDEASLASRTEFSPYSGLELLERDAKEALEIMSVVARMHVSRL